MDNYLALLEGLPSQAIHTDRPERKNMKCTWKFHSELKLTVYALRLCRRIMMTQTFTGQLNGGLEMI